MTDAVLEQGLAANDFASGNEVRWCPGCGDYAILKAVKKTLSEVGAALENTVFISGIGCASRFPHYVSTYGFHSIHGRAPALATGVKLANPDLDMWIITGDGDGLSIGGNHLLHLLRRNVDCQILMFNNEIYGLTKGQYSPTSHVNTRSPSSPAGSVDTPVDPAVFALGCGARFVARAVDDAAPEPPRRGDDQPRRPRGARRGAAAAPGAPDPGPGAGAATAFVGLDGLCVAGRSAPSDNGDHCRVLTRTNWRRHAAGEARPTSIVASSRPGGGALCRSIAPRPECWETPSRGSSDH